MKEEQNNKTEQEKFIYTLTTKILADSAFKYSSEYN